MIELRNVIRALLKTCHSRVDYQETSNKTLYPYVVFDFPTSFTNEDQEVFTLDVDVWDNKQDTTALETLAEVIWRKLNRYHHINSNIQFTVYRDRRLPPLDEDKDIKRRKLIFQVKYFDRRLGNV